MRVFAIGSLQLAMKTDEILPISIDELQAQFPPPAPFDSNPIPKSSVWRAERLILNVLNYRLWITTPYCLLKGISALERRHLQG